MALWRWDPDVRHKNQAPNGTKLDGGGILVLMLRRAPTSRCDWYLGTWVLVDFADSEFISHHKDNPPNGAKIDAAAILYWRAPTSRLNRYRET